MKTPSDWRYGWREDPYPFICTVIAFVLIVGVAPAVHPILGVLSLWPGIYLAPVFGLFLGLALPILIFMGAVVAAGIFFFSAGRGV